MPAPSQLSIAIASVQRLTKEEQQYHKELTNQEARVAKLEKDIADNNPDLDENASYSLTQEVHKPLLLSPLLFFFSSLFLSLGLLTHHTQPVQKQARDETKAMFPHLHTRISDAVAKLEEKIALADSDPATAPADLAKAREVFAQGREALKATAG